MGFIKRHFIAVVIGAILLLLLWNWWRKRNATPKSAFIDILSAKAATKTVRFRMNINGDVGPDREIKLGDNTCVAGRNGTKSCWKTNGNQLVISLVDAKDDKKVYDQIIANFDKKVESKYVEKAPSKDKQPLVYKVNPAALSFDRVKEKQTLESLFTLTSELNKNRKECSEKRKQLSAAILDNISSVGAYVQHPGVRNSINEFNQGYARMIPNCSNKAVGRKLGMLNGINDKLNNYDKTF